MTFKECRKFGRDELNKNKKSYGFIYKDKNNDFSFSLIKYDTLDLVYILEKNGVVDKVINGHWIWDFEKRGFHPKNKKNWNKRKDI